MYIISNIYNEDQILLCDRLVPKWRLYLTLIVHNILLSQANIYIGIYVDEINMKVQLFFRINLFKVASTQNLTQLHFVPTTLRHSCLLR